MTHTYLPECREEREATCGVSQSAARSMTRSRRRTAALPGSDASSVPSRARARRQHSPSGRACPREPRPFAGARSHQRPAWSPPAPRGGAEGSARLQRGHGVRLRRGCSGVQWVRTSLPFLSILKVGIALTPYCDCRSLHSSTSTCDHTHTNRQSVCSHTGAAARVRGRAMCAWLASGCACGCYLDKAHVRHVRGHRRELGRDLLARPAPAGREVHHDQLLLRRAGEQLVELRLRVH